jgi:hypothetical protein
MTSLLGAAALILAACDSGSVNTNNNDDGGVGGDQPDAFVPTGPFPDGGPGCPAVNVNLEPVTPTVLLLLDQSGSMTADFGTGTNPPDRWNAMKSALVNATSGVVAQLQDSVIFGATLYTSHNGGATCPILQSELPALNNLAAIKALLDANAPDDDTPTGPSIMGAMSILQGISQDPDAPPSPMIIVLATDGEPDNCTTPDPQTDQAKADSIAAAQAAYTAGFPLFILSVGNEVGLAHQQDMANAGAGKKIDHSEGDAPFYSADNPADLKARFNEIINGVRECTFAISGAVDASQAGDGTVKLNGQTLGYDDPNGWSLVDESTLKLNGTACDTFLEDPSVSLSAEFPCGVVVQ